VQNVGNSDVNGINKNLGLLDGWSDFNGDGEIDFVVIKGECAGNSKNSSNSNASKYREIESSLLTMNHPHFGQKIYRKI
jgi:predicted AAA+ superfamily ATPase